MAQKVLPQSLSAFKQTIFKLFGPSSSPVKLPDVSTRYASLHGFQGGADFEETYPSTSPYPYEAAENYKAMGIHTFGVAHDLPACYGYPGGDVKIGDVVLRHNAAVNAFVRDGGVPIVAGAFGDFQTE